MDQFTNLFEDLFFNFCNISKMILGTTTALELLKKGCDQDAEGSIKSLFNAGVCFCALYSVDPVLTMIQDAFARR